MRRKPRFQPNDVDKPRLPQRRSLRLRTWSYSSTGWYYVTLCTHGKVCLFGRVRSGEMVLNANGQIVDDCWQAIPDHFPGVLLLDWIVMPNHMHGLLLIPGSHEAPATTQPPRPLRIAPGSLGAILRSFKGAAKVAVNRLRGTPGAPLWQRNYYDHIVRDDDELERIRRYIRENPLRWENGPESGD